MAAHYIGGAHHMGDGRVHPAPENGNGGNGNGMGEMPQISKDMALVLVLAQDPNVKIDKGTYLEFELRFFSQGSKDVSVYSNILQGWLTIIFACNLLHVHLCM